jgi:hypothetical protein
VTLLCFASQKGSPGTSAAALAVAAALRPGPGRRKLLLEADGSGGVLAIRYRLPFEPGLVTLAAAARAGLEPDDLWRHTAELPGGLAAVVCPDGAEQVGAALAAAGGPLGRHLAERRDIDVVCDVGRLPPESPAIDFVVEATALLMVARPTAEQLQPAARRMQSLRARVRNIGWLLVGERPHGPAEVEATFGFPVVGVLADDRRSVEAIEGGALTRRVRRHPFVRSAVTVADTLGGWLAPLAAPSTTPTGEAILDADDVDDVEAAAATEGGPGHIPGPSLGSAPEPIPTEVDAPTPTPTSTPTPTPTPAPTPTTTLASTSTLAPAPDTTSVPTPTTTLASTSTLAPAPDTTSVPTPTTTLASTSTLAPAPRPPRPPARPAPPASPDGSRGTVPPTPFVHDDDDWAGS